MLQSLLHRSEFVRRIRGYWGIENKVADLCKKTIDSYVPKLMSTQVKLPLQTERLLIRDLKESDWEAVPPCKQRYRPSKSPRARSMRAPVNR